MSELPRTAKPRSLALKIWILWQKCCSFALHIQFAAVKLDFVKETNKY